MKKVGVISDTHLSETGRRCISDSVLRLLRGVDFIIHAGDFTSRRALTDLEQVAPVVGVRGNNDPAHLELPLTRRIQVEQVTIGLCHGDQALSNWLPPLEMMPGNNHTSANALANFEFETDVTCLVFGHSHIPMSRWHRVAEREILFFNPGSPTDKRFGPRYGCGLFTIDGDMVEPELILW